MAPNPVGANLVFAPLVLFALLLLSALLVPCSPFLFLFALLVLPSLLSSSNSSYALHPVTLHLPVA